MTEQSTDYDIPGNEIIELYFNSFLELFFPLAYAEIGWNRPYQFLDKELHQLEADAEIGKRLVDRQDIRQLFRFIDWIMVLPEELAINFKTEIRSYEEARKMRYVTSIERLAKQEGIEEGLQEGRQLGVIQTSQDSVIEVLETRFGEVPTSIIDAVNNINDLSQLKTLLKGAIAIPSISEFEQLLPQN
jgi:flagellar biosynthesis/type III secretory pathway protein FliH